jgi:ElaB/YqjD/DUF883 family membrane-anchored ribosome-binding protein
MNTMITLVKRLQLARIVVVFLAGILLLVSVACSQPPSVKTSNNPGYNSDYQNPSGNDTDNNVVLKEVKESYKTVSPQGGMNGYRDTDRRQNTSASDTKAQELINRSKGNLSKGVRNPKEAVENVRNDASLDKIKDSFEDLSKNVNNSVNDSTRQIKQGTERGLENLKTNLKSTTDQVSDSVKQVIQ